MGIIDSVGPGVTLLKKGDRVVMPFNVADGRCLNCEEGKTAYCTGVNPGFAGGAYGYVAMGPYAGGQVHLLSIFNPFPPRFLALPSNLNPFNPNASRRNTCASPSPTSTPCPFPRAPRTNPPSPCSRTSSPRAGTASRSRTSPPANPSPSSAPAPSG